MLAASGDPDAAAAELRALRPLLADAFGANSTQVRNLDKQVSRLRAPTSYPMSDLRERTLRRLRPSLVPNAQITGCLFG